LSFAFAWHVIITVLLVASRDRHSWLAILLALAGAFFPVYVAVNMGYQEAFRRSRVKDPWTEPLSTESRDDAPQQFSEAITANPPKIRASDSASEHLREQD